METRASEGPTITSSPASTSSTSDNDAVNSSTARIYFGPTQSPEKKFAYAVGSNVFSNGSLVRRSTRLSVATTPLAIQCEDVPAEDSDLYQGVSLRGNEGENEMEEGTDGQSRSNTPENEQIIPDEPSSILANKVIHALDNPSPPPQTQDLPEHVFPLLDGSEIRLADISESPIHPSEVPEPEYAIQVTTPSDMLLPLLVLDRSPNLPLLTVRDSSLEPEASTLHQDLISFKCNPELSTSIHINIDAPAPEASTPSTHIPRAQILTVDDFLLHSPIPSPGRKRRSPSPLAEGHDGTALGSQPVRRSARLSIARSIESPMSSPSVVRKRKQESANASINTMGFPENVTLSSSQSPSPTPEPNGSLENRGGMGRSDYAQNHGEDVPQTTPRAARRSPRRSLTPRAFGKSDVSFPPTGTIVDKKQWKGKGRALSPALEAVSDSTDDATKEGIADNQSLNLDVPSSEIGAAEQEVPSSETMRRRKSTHAKAQVEEERELRSLSPDSSDVLMQLFPLHRDSRSRSKSPTVKQTSIQITSQPEEPPPRTPPPPSSFPTQRPNASNFPSSIQRPAILYNPERQGITLHSPSKYATRVLDDPNRTPARRVPLEQALTEGTLSPERASQLTLKPSTQAGPSRSPVFKRLAIDDSTRTPAQRIPISEAMRSNQAQKYRSPVREVVRASGTARFPSPVRGGSIERMLHGAKRPPDRHASRERSRSVDPPPSMLVHSTSSSTRPTPQLPFPLVARSAKTDLPPPIPEETGLGPALQSPRRYIASSAQLAATDSPAKKSRLRQPTTTSRIPRMGAKPYARPPSAKSKAPPVAQKPAGHGNANLSLLRTGSGSGNSSDDLSMKATGSGTASTTHVRSTADNASSSSLKRKRSPETKMSPSKKQPHMLMLRQVVPGILDAKYAPKAPPASTRGVEPDPASQLLKQIQPTGRKVVDGIIHRNLNQEYAKTQTNTGGDVAEQAQALEITPAESPDARAKKHVPSGSSILCDRDSSPVPSITPAAELPVSGDINRTPPSETTESLSNVRRTTRARKQTHIADVFGTIAPQPTQPRRRAATSRSEPVFAGMSAIALRALTSSNTTKNQHYVAAKLETEVVRKEGDRPESPVVKVRTISQREKDEKLRERRERAERRARRGDKDPGGSSDNEGISDRGNSSAVEAEEDSDAEEFPLRYRMGPGDEEEYTTPDNKTGSAKRARLTEVEAERDSKRVKWDRGLSTTIYLDDLEPKPRKPPKDEVLKKGCLSQSAKSLHLDSLGNLLNADAPLPDLVHQSIVVKKFVYDNDVESHTPIAKATRSKSKKTKG